MAELFTKCKIDKKGPESILGLSKITKRRSCVGILVLLTLESVLIFLNI